MLTQKLRLQTSCEIVNRDSGQVYDLRPLTKKFLFNWEAEEFSISTGLAFEHARDPDNKFYFNVCRKLNKLGNYGEKCPTDSFATVTQPRVTNATGISLGRHMEEIYFGEDGTIVVKYTGGDPCPHNGDSPGISKPKFRSSILTLACSPSDEEAPKILRK